MRLKIKSKTTATYSVKLSESEAANLLDEMVDLILGYGNDHSMNLQALRERFPLAVAVQEKLRDR